MPISRPARRRTVFVRTAAAAAVVSGFTLAAGPADAHVRVIPDNPSTGSFSALTFRVPNESPTAGTVKLAVQLPADKPFLFVSAKPVPGWNVKVTEEPLAKPVEAEGTTITKSARTVTWTAKDGEQIGPGEYQEFSLSVGPLPAAGELTLPATQTYSDKTVVSWDEPTPASGEEPEHPAPAFEVVAAGATDGDGDSHDENHGASESPAAASSAPAASNAPAASTVDAASTGGQPDTAARWLGGLALLAALGAVAIAAVGRRGASR